MITIFWDIYVVRSFERIRLTIWICGRVIAFFITIYNGFWNFSGISTRSYTTNQALFCSLCLHVWQGCMYCN